MASLYSNVHGKTYFQPDFMHTTFLSYVHDKSSHQRLSQSEYGIQPLVPSQDPEPYLVQYPRTQPATVNAGVAGSLGEYSVGTAVVGNVVVSKTIQLTADNIRVCSRHILSSRTGLHQFKS
jgi:hypothetical protein